jgi:muramidase (phage lysozyme)
MASRREYYESLLSNPNVQRALASIRAAEGTAKYQDPYSVGFGGRRIDDLSRHPGTLSSFSDNSGHRSKTSAAGGYQFLNSSWGDMERQLGLTDFGPRSQDVAAVGLLDRSGALDNVLSGDIDGFVKDANGTWASLPGSPYNQPTRSKSFMRNAWNSYTPPEDIPNVNAYTATPTPRPAENPFDAVLTDAAYRPSFPATPSPVQREALPDVTPVAFDNGRFGTPQPASFDYGRFGSPTGKTGRLPADVPAQFDPERFGTPGTLATTPQQLQRGLLDQALDAGELPGLLGPATSWPGQAPAPVAGYVDPRVTTQPDSINTAAVQPPEVSAPVSPGMAGQPQGDLLGGPLQQTNPADFQAYADRTRQAMQRQNLLGGLGGGLLGGLALGPIGAIAGGLLGKTIAQRNFFPEAPPANPNNKQQKTGYAALDESGRRSYSESKQFRDAVDGKMSPGLW